ncbi:CD225/dispanin family protein [Nocardiopsis sp. CNT312]|uniref:CD225/dispanin family protein n=1 Tax=Nocardiopsis sp. CNT312 TaxID=1137268 RepID=UPI00048FF615|nr:CD225/dispanin family protein [Nocardiopsis sp. CNT312]
MSYGPPPPGNPGPPPGGYGPPAGGPAGERPKNYLVHNILGIFGCTIVGIIGLVFSLQVNSKWDSGDYAGAQSAAGTAKILGIISLVSFILAVIFWIVYIVFVVLVLGASTATTTYGY